MPAAHFNKNVWRKRSWGRFQRAIRAGKDSCSFEQQYYRDMLAIDAIDKVVLWCGHRGVGVRFAKRKDGIYDRCNREIVISSHAPPEKQLHYLIHECGHHLIGSEENHDRFRWGYPYTADPAVNRGFHHKLSCLEEELEAWHRGWRLTVRLKLKINRDSYDLTRLDCIKTYVRWVARAGK
jgi:hypothetical protein